VAELCAMADPEKNMQDAWDLYQDHILRLVRDRLTWVSGPRGCEKHCWVVLDKVKKSFFRNFLSGSNWWPEDVQVGSKTPETEAFWRKMSIPGLIDRVVEGFVMEERRRLWFAHRAIVISNLQKALPACARQFEADYTEFFLVKFVFRKFDAGFPEGRSADEFEEWLKQLVKEVAAEEIPKLINDKGELIDEELVRLATSGYEAASVQLMAGHEAASVELMARYSPKIKKIVAGIVHKHGLCPPSQDVPSLQKLFQA
jgi:hypothetical protein